MTQTSYCTDHELGGETITEITLTGRNALAPRSSPLEASSVTFRCR